MRHGRAKQARKTLQFFERSISANSNGSSQHGKQPAYHVVLDGTFVVAILQYKIPLHDRLDVLLQHTPFHLYVCSSTIVELQTLFTQSQQKSKKKSAVSAEKSELFQRAIEWCQEKCQVVSIDRPDDSATNNEETALSVAASDIERLVVTGAAIDHGDAASVPSITHQRRHYFCASQDEELLHRLRSISAISAISVSSSKTLYVPLIRLARGSVLLLEQPSKTSTRSSTNHERSKWTNSASTLATGENNNAPKSAMAAREQELVQMVRQQEQLKRKRSKSLSTRESTSADMPTRTVQRSSSKARGPNPLSCKKKRSSASVATASTTSAPISKQTATGAHEGINVDSSSAAESQPRKRRRKAKSDVPEKQAESS